MNKEFIPYEQALELKELGFDERCLTSYANDGDLMSVWNVDSSFESATTMNDEPDAAYVRNSVDFKESSWCAAPLYRQAFKFFREKHNFTFSIGKLNHVVLHVPVNDYSTTFVIDQQETYELAEIECLKKMIEIAKDYGKDK